MDIYEAEALPRTGLVFSSEFVPNAGAVWSRLWKIRAFLIIGRFTTRQSVLSSEMGGMKRGAGWTRKKKKEEKRTKLEAVGRTRKRKQWILRIIYKLRGHWCSVPVSYLHGYFKRENKQAAPQLPISILWPSGIWHRPRHREPSPQAPAGVMRLRCHLF